MYYIWKFYFILPYNKYNRVGGTQVTKKKLLRAINIKYSPPFVFMHQAQKLRYKSEEV